MDSDSASDQDVTLVYIRLVRYQSPDAAAVIEQIHRDFGSQAALRAALAITLLKTELQQFHALPTLGMYTYLLKDWLAAIPLFEDALARCLVSWGIPQTSQPGWKQGQRPPDLPSEAYRSPFAGLLQQIRQDTPITAVKLEQIAKMHGVTAGGYAAAALIWLEARLNRFGDHFPSELTDSEIREFLYVEYMREQAGAVDQFIDLLDCYRTERRPASSSAFTATYLALKAEQQASRHEDHT